MKTRRYRGNNVRMQCDASEGNCSGFDAGINFIRHIEQQQRRGGLHQQQQLRSPEGNQPDNPINKLDPTLHPAGSRPLCCRFNWHFRRGRRFYFRQFFTLHTHTHTRLSLDFLFAESIERIRTGHALSTFLTDFFLFFGVYELEKDWFYFFVSFTFVCVI